MGATHVCSQKAFSVVGTDNQVYFFLAESTFESNCYPRTPHACVTFFGTAAECMDRIIRYSSDCEGGMLKGARGDIKPETYVEKWRVALRNATRIDPEMVKLKFDFSVSFFAIEKEKRAAVEQLLQGASIDLQQMKMTGGDGYRVPLSSAMNVLPQILALGISAWRLVEVHALDVARTGEVFGYTIRKNRVQPEIANLCIVRFPDASEDHHYSRNYLLYRRGTRTWDFGWAYSTVAKLIVNDVNQAEVRFPGCAEHATEFFRNMVNSAPVLDARTLVRIQKPVFRCEDPWIERSFREIATAIGMTGDTLEFRLDEIPLTCAMVSNLKGMGPEVLTFLEIHTVDGACLLRADLNQSTRLTPEESAALVC